MIITIDELVAEMDVMLRQACAETPGADYDRIIVALAEVL